MATFGLYRCLIENEISTNMLASVIIAESIPSTSEVYTNLKVFEVNSKSSEQTDLASERPIGVEEQKVIETQEREAEQAEQRVPETEEPEEAREQVDEILEGGKERQRSKKEDLTRKLFDEFAKHFQISKVASDKTTNTLK